MPRDLSADNVIVTYERTAVIALICFGVYEFCRRRTQNQQINANN